MLNIIEKKKDLVDNKKSRRENLALFCDRCRKFARISEIARKRINQIQVFCVFVYYCRRCDIYYLEFKTIESEKQ